MNFLWDIYINGKLDHRTWLSNCELMASGYKWSSKLNGWIRTSKELGQVVARASN